MLPSILIILAFIILAVLMITKKLPTLLAMPIMAIVTGLIAGLFSGLPLFGSGSRMITSFNAGISFPLASIQYKYQAGENSSSLANFIFVTIITEGSIKLAKAMMYAIFGAILSQVVMKTGIAERVIKIAAELAGDRKTILAILLTGASSLVFSSLTGLGGFIMIGSLVLPVMIAAGISPLLSSSLLLFSLAVGGIFNAANWGFYESALGVSLVTIKSFAAAYGILLIVVTILFLLIEVKRDRLRFAWASSAAGESSRAPAISLITPLIPVFLLLNPWFRWEIIPAFMVAILFGILTTNPVKAIPTLTAATIEGIRDIGPVLGLFAGIGMVLAAVMDPVASGIMRPLLTSIIPHGSIGYILFFGLLAPLALYRGPLNLWGLGIGLAALLVGSGILSPVAVMGAFLASGQIQSICDPTNTHNVWVAQFTKITTEDILKKTIIYVWIFVFAGLIYAVLFGGVK